MATIAPTERDVRGCDFKQKDASAWISFDPAMTGHRKDVRSAAAKSSAAARKATIAKKLALSTDCTSPTERTPRPSKKRRREQTDASPTSSSSSAPSRRQSEVSLASLASTNSPISSATSSPCFLQAPPLPMPSPWMLDSSPLAHSKPASLPSPSDSLHQVVLFLLGIETSLGHAGAREPTHFGASRLKSRTIGKVHDALATRQPGSSTLLAVALLAAWDLRFGDERSSSLHLSAWHQLALSQHLLPHNDGIAPTEVTLIEALKLSLQLHLPPDVLASTWTFIGHTPYQFLPGQIVSGRDTVCFFDIVADLVE